MTASLRVSDVELMSCQAVHERPHQVVGGEVEDEAERDGDGQSRESFLKDGQQQESQTQTLQGDQRHLQKSKESNHTPSQRHVCVCVCVHFVPLTIRMATKQANVVFQSPPVAAAFPTRTL